ncbi:putative Stomatin/HflK/HflC family, Band 7/SPFH domain superfamily [Helianthus anomalus]
MIHHFHFRKSWNFAVNVGKMCGFSNVLFLQIAINEAEKDWGLQCLRYEIRDISPPRGVKAAMKMQAEAKRKKRAKILESEGNTSSHLYISLEEHV